MEKEAFEMDSESQIRVWQAETGGMRKLRCSKKGETEQGQ